jgi:radical SAM-linked protein
MRVRITFAKTDLMRFTGHLDLHRAWERLIRRAGLPLAYSQGFSPHPRINLASALPLGFTSDCELVDIWLEQEIDSDDIRLALAQAAPPGISILEVTPVDERLPALQTVVEASEFSVTFLDPADDLEVRCQTMLTTEKLPRLWRSKPYDLRPLILDLRLLSDDGLGHRRMAATLSAREGATGRPEEVIASLGYIPESTRVHRERLIFKENVSVASG